MHASIILLLPPHLHRPHGCNTILQYHCAIFEPLSTARFHATHHTILCMAISQYRVKAKTKSTLCRICIASVQNSKNPTRVAVPSPRASLGRRTVCGCTEQPRRPPVVKRYETKARMVCGSFLIAAAALKTPTRNGYNAQGRHPHLCIPASLRTYS